MGKLYPHKKDEITEGMHSRLNVSDKKETFAMLVNSLDRVFNQPSKCVRKLLTHFLCWQGVGWGREYC